MISKKHIHTFFNIEKNVNLIKVYKEIIILGTDLREFIITI